MLSTELGTEGNFRIIRGHENEYCLQLPVGVASPRQNGNARMLSFTSRNGEIQWYLSTH